MKWCCATDKRKQFNHNQHTQTHKHTRLKFRVAHWTNKATSMVRTRKPTQLSFLSQPRARDDSGRTSTLFEKQRNNLLNCFTCCLSNSHIIALNEVINYDDDKDIFTLISAHRLWNVNASHFVASKGSTRRQQIVHNRKQNRKISDARHS